MPTTSTERLKELHAKRDKWISENRPKDDAAPNWSWNMKFSEEADELYELEAAAEEFANLRTPKPASTEEVMRNQYVDRLTDRPHKKGNAGDWQGRHMQAAHSPNGPEVPIVVLLRGWLKYADHHVERYESGIGEDGARDRHRRQRRAGPARRRHIGRPHPRRPEGRRLRPGPDVTLKETP